ncbi:MAG TPA: toll/interleukin-1 receptor domain-containing protein, partial [Gemmataceae bacterium]|nr:toll/interleukin-1 receptor domain-containing protein [Gemmataceae bacterium]
MTAKLKKPAQTNFKIVISWRRSCPSAGSVHRIYDRLSDRYGKEAIFFDLESMRVGNFPDQISQAIGHASVLLVLVGKEWAGKDGAIDRIMDPRDWVRQEISAAYERYRKNKETSIKLIVVSIDKAIVPRHPDLEAVPSLKHLVFNHALPISGDRELGGIDKLIECLDKHVPAKNRFWNLATLASVFVMLFLLLLSAFYINSWPQSGNLPVEKTSSEKSDKSSPVVKGDISKSQAKKNGDVVITSNAIKSVAKKKDGEGFVLPLPNIANVAGWPDFDAAFDKGMSKQYVKIHKHGWIGLNTGTFVVPGSPRIDEQGHCVFKIKAYEGPPSFSANKGVVGLKWSYKLASGEAKTGEVSEDGQLVDLSG